MSMRFCRTSQEPRTRLRKSSRETQRASQPSSLMHVTVVARGLCSRHEVSPQLSWSGVRVRVRVGVRVRVRVGIRARVRVRVRVRDRVRVSVRVVLGYPNPNSQVEPIEGAAVLEHLVRLRLRLRLSA